MLKIKEILLKNKTRTCLWGALGLFIMFLLFMKIVPFGSITYKSNFRDNDYFIRKLTPADRIEKNDKENIKIIGDPVYFSLFTPRHFNTAELELKYKTFGEGKKFFNIEAGVLVDDKLWRYDLEPLENFLIDNLQGGFSKTEAENVILLQREANEEHEVYQYDSIQEFLNNLPDSSKIALYNYDLKREYIIKDYEKKDEKKEVLNASLRGTYQFYTYLKDEDLDFKFTFFDLNENKDKDDIELFIYYADELIDSRYIEDDGVAEDNGEASEPIVAEFNLKNLPEGIYKIELRANDDIVTERIITTQRKVSFINSLWFYSRAADDIVLYTDSSVIQAKAPAPRGKQTVFIDDKPFLINEAYRQFEMEIEKKPGAFSRIEPERGNFILSGNGVFGFKTDSLVNPRLRKIDKTFDADREGIDYILAGYQSPRKEEGWKIARTVVDLNGAYRENGKYGFMISAPGLKADDQIYDGIEIKEIKIKLKGKNLWQKLFD